MHEPEELRLTRQTLNLSEWRTRSAAEEDAPRLVQESALVYDEQSRELAIVYLVLDDDCAEITAALRSIHYQSGARSGGMATTSRIFGNSPRLLPRRDFCTSTALSRENPSAHDLIASYSAKVSAHYERWNPELYAKHTEEVDAVLPEWRLKESAFTSGIINRNNPLPYHFDAGNFAHVWSNMLVFKEDIEGGHLSVPEYGVRFELPNNSLLMFDGQGLLHGVTPIIKRDPDATRFSIVYYSLKQMWKCLPVGEEITRAGKRRVEREGRRRRGEVSAEVVAEAAKNR